MITILLLVLAILIAGIYIGFTFGYELGYETCNKFNERTKYKHKIKHNQYLLNKDTLFQIYYHSQSRHLSRFSFLSFYEKESVMTLSLAKTLQESAMLCF